MSERHATDDSRTESVADATGPVERLRVRVLKFEDGIILDVFILFAWAAVVAIAFRLLEAPLGAYYIAMSVGGLAYLWIVWSRKVLSDR